jgi:hypothetical protein
LQQYTSDASEQMDDRIRIQLDEIGAAVQELLTQLGEGVA